MEYIISKDQYLQVKATWTGVQNHKACDMVMYNLLRGHDPRRGFTEIKNPSKVISNCNDPWHGYNDALSRLSVYRFETDTRFISVEKYAAKFKETYGVDLTAEIKAAILKAERS